MVSATRLLQEDPADERVVIHGLSWNQYEEILAALGESAGVRLSYLEGTLEIMSPSRRHELVNTALGRLVEAYAEELNLTLTGFGSATFRKQAKKRGVEPDKCYLFRVPHGADDPAAPDLAIEIALSPWHVDRFAIYAGLGVPELWIWSDDEIDVYVLRGPRYRRMARSRAFPKLDLKLVAKLAQRPDQTAAVRAFRTRLKSQ